MVRDWICLEGEEIDRDFYSPDIRRREEEEEEEEGESAPVDCLR